MPPVNLLAMATSRKGVSLKEDELGIDHWKLWLFLFKFLQLLAYYCVYIIPIIRSEHRLTHLRSNYATNNDKQSTYYVHRIFS